jgi:hypothetical protein
LLSSAFGVSGDGIFGETQREKTGKERRDREERQRRSGKGRWRERGETHGRDRWVEAQRKRQRIEGRDRKYRLDTEVRTQSRKETARKVQWREVGRGDKRKI